MCRVLITGAAGFLGQRLTTRLLQTGKLGGTAIQQIILTDVAGVNIPDHPSPNGSDRPKIILRQGSLADPGFVRQLTNEGFDSLFHLASLLTLQAENDPEMAYQVNVGALRHLISQCHNKPKVIFTSSIAIHGGDLPAEVEDDLNPVPATTYGTHKAINELLISDYSRLGKIDGRCLRLPIVVTRPGSPTPAISDQVASLLRNPLQGLDVVSPFSPNTQVPIASAGAVVASLMHLHDLPGDQLPAKRAINMPALTVTISDVAKAVGSLAGSGKITYRPNPHLQAIVDGWPRRFESRHARQLGIAPDVNLQAVIQDYLQHKGQQDAR